MFLVDTNVLSESTRQKPSSSVLQWLGSQQTVKACAVTVMELEYGIARLPAGAKRDRLMQWFEGVLSSAAVEVVPIDVAVARAAGRLKRRSEAAGRPRDEADLLIAAAAQVTGSVVATRNTADFEGLGVPVFDPFA